MMEEYNDYISVVMSTYNECETELRQAVESVLAQTYDHYEFIIVLDNPNQKRIAEIIEDYASRDQRIKILRHEKNLGLTRSLNDGIKMASGTLIARMDADDILMPECLKNELIAMHHRNLDFVAASKRNIDEHGTVIGTYINCFSPQIMRRLLPYENSVNHPSVLMKKQIVEQLGGYREISACEDYDLWIRLLCLGCRIEILPDILVHYRTRANSITRSNEFKRHLAEIFIKRQYQYFKKNHKLLTIDQYHTFMKSHFSSRKEQRFSKSYQDYCEALGFIKQKKLFSAIKYMSKSVITDYHIIMIICRKLIYHFRKAAVLRIFGKKLERNCL